MKNIAVKFHGGSALDEKIVLFEPQKTGIQNPESPGALRKTQDPHE